MPATIREDQIDRLKQALDTYVRAKEGVSPGNIDDPEELALITQHRTTKAKLALENMGIVVERALET